MYFCQHGGSFQVDLHPKLHVSCLKISSDHKGGKLMQARAHFLTLLGRMKPAYGVRLQVVNMFPWVKQLLSCPSLIDSVSRPLP